MMYWQATALISLIAALSVAGQIPPQDMIRCRACNNAVNLENCPTNAVCDNRTEMCYMEEIITASFEIMYRGGCRARQHCNPSMHLIGRRNSLEVTSCSECCSLHDGCNERLCGIRSLVNVSQCYHCDSNAAGATQGDVMDPNDCVTFTTCDSNEVCQAETRHHPGSPLTYRYGCQNKNICKLLMKRAFDHLQACEGREGTEGCQFQSTCFVCCAEGGCNYGDCNTTLKELYRQYKMNIFSLDTLKSTPAG
ncbi:uncharacterized protein LOC128222717 [Mya arenaria]|uniref:uncharacterized protein LOC128222717 n=1 Tax=Mya arenaria TaxID=6604 RepID=UPI0022E8023E|nr:uncharacterized protein LOC128222717 [Mya arenaria]